MLDNKTITRFFSKTKLATEIRPGMKTPCLEWTGGRDRDGYGRVQTRTAFRAHRVVWEMERGTIPKGLCILHRCDNPPCVAIDHLFLGTDIDNVIDRDRKNRQAKGDSNGARRHPECLARGDRSGPRLHPERMARGDANGSRLHPESRSRGETHSIRMLEVASRGEAHSTIMRRVSARGVAHGSRLHPESRPRGDSNGSRLHPERLRRGEAHGRAKLTEVNIGFIFRLRKEGWKQKRIAAEFAVSLALINSILAGKVWAHVQVDDLAKPVP